MPVPAVPGLIAALVAALITALRIYLAAMLGRVLLAFGVGLYVYTAAVPDLVAWIAAQFSGLPPFVRESAAASGVDIFITMVLSALGVKLSSRVFLGRSSPV